MKRIVLAGVVFLALSTALFLPAGNSNCEAATQPAEGSADAEASRPVDGGVLVFLDYGLSDGRIAKRVFKDQAGRIIREIWYIADRPLYPHEAKAADGLREWCSTVFRYDAAGLLALEQSYSSRRELRASTEYLYWPDGGRRLAIHRTAQGVRYYEVRYPQTGKRTILSFDRATGTRLRCITGPVPKDVDLADGWGQPSESLSCGITTENANVVNCTIKNVTDATARVAQDFIGKLVRLELRDSGGKIVPYKDDAIDSLSKRAHPKKKVLAAGHAIQEYYVLQDWYGKLAPGKYTLRLRRRGAGNDFSLSSNTIDILVRIPVTVIAAQDGLLRITGLGGHDMDILPDRVFEKIGPGEWESAGSGITIEGIKVSMRDGQVTFVSPHGQWTASIVNGQVRLVAIDRKSGRKTEYLRPQLRVSLHQGRLEVLGAASVPQMPLLPPAEKWGEAVEGVRVQLRADKKVWKVGENPILKADVRNTGKRDLYLPYCYFQAEVEVDGRSYRYTGPSNISRRDHGPYARQREDIKIYLYLHSWTAVGDIRHQLGLKPGRHVIRVAFYAKPDDGQPIRAVSNPVEIEIHPATGPSDLGSQEYKQERTRIKALEESFTPGPTNDLKKYEEFADEIQSKWSRGNKEYYARLMLEICIPLSSGNFKDDRRHELARKYALLALEKPEDIPVRLELELTGHVITLMSPRNAPKGADFAQRRKKDVEIRLHAWKRLIDAIDPNWDPNEELMGPNGVGAMMGLPGGIAPESVKDPKLRAEYEAALEANQEKIERYTEQNRLHKWLKRFPKRAERYFIRAYSKAPLNLAELKQYLDKYMVDEKTRARILDAVTKNMAKQTG